MPRYEYKVVPAPAKGRKAKGVKTPEARFALSVETVLNEMGADGWEYLRADLLPSDERSGLTGSTTHWRNLLVFRRPLDGAEDMFHPRLIETPDLTAAPLVPVPDPTAPAPPEPGAPEARSLDPAEPPLHAARAESGDDDAESDDETDPARTSRDNDDDSDPDKERG